MSVRTTLFASSPMFFVLASVLVGCPGPEQVEAGVVSWELEGLEPLGDGYVYEGWVIVDGEPLSTGRFDIHDGGHAGLDSFALTADEIDGAEAFVLSIEPETGDDPAPSDVKVLAGDFADGEATLSIAHAAALGTDLADAVAPFFLETPTSAAVADDYTQGIWWLDPAGGPSMDLPELPVGWTYEGWIVTDDGPVSTGRFDAGDMADSDGAGPDAGPDGAPPFPGQDFIEPPLDLVGATTVISVEPVPDDSPAPFALKPLVADIEDPGTGTLQDMTNQADTAPSGVASIQ